MIVFTFLQTQSLLTEATGWVVLGFISLLGLLVLYNIYIGRIDLSRLISEPTGDASMSRFQLLIFTFVIGASLFLVIASAKGGAQFPATIPQGVLVLLGISSSSYLVSKGIQFSNADGVKDRKIEAVVSPANVATTAGGAAVQFTCAIPKLTNQAVTWDIQPKFGAIDKNGLYTPPAVAPGAPVTVTATSVTEPEVTGAATVTVS